MLGSCLRTKCVLNIRAISLYLAVLAVKKSATLMATFLKGFLAISNLVHEESVMGQFYSGQFYDLI